MLGMFRRAFTILVMVSIAAFSYQPSLAMVMPADRAAAVDTAPIAEPMAMTDCAGETQERDCCHHPDQQKQDCAWDSGCAMRCHGSAAIAVAIDAPLFMFNPAEPLMMSEQRSLVPERPGSLFRPPIL